MEPRDIKRLIYFGIFIIFIIFGAFNGFKGKRIAKNNGFDNIKEYNEYKRQEEKEKEIIFYTNGTIKEDSYLLTSLKDKGLRPEINILNSYNYTLPAQIAFLDTEKRNIMDVNIYHDYFSVAVEGEGKSVEEINEKMKETLMLAEKTVTSYSEKDIVIISPNYITDNEDEIDKNNGDYSYEDFINAVVKGCEENNIDYINLYEYTKNSPIKIKDKVNVYDERIQKYLFEKIMNIIQK